jgi:hypothetical protein
VPAEITEVISHGIPAFKIEGPKYKGENPGTDGTFPNFLSLGNKSEVVLPGIGGGLFGADVPFLERVAAKSPVRAEQRIRLSPGVMACSPDEASDGQRAQQTAGCLFERR